MAIYHLSVKIFGRSKGQSVIAKAAYRAGEKMRDEETGKTYDYTNKKEVAFSEIMLCKSAPREYSDRKTLWSAVQKIEKNANAQLAREIEVALPKEFDFEAQKTVLREYIQKNFTSRGMIADWSIHAKEGNPHAHILLTTRGIKPSGEWDAKERKQYKLDENGNKIPILNADGTQKTGANNRKMWERETVQTNGWNDRENVEEWRKNWAEICNARLPQENKIDHRSYARQGLDIEPTVHIGYKQKAMSEKDVELTNDKALINAQIREKNNFLKILRDGLQKAAKEFLSECRARVDEIKSGVGRIFDAVERRKAGVERTFDAIKRRGARIDVENIGNRLADCAVSRGNAQKQRDAEQPVKAKENVPGLQEREIEALRKWLNKIQAMSPPEWEAFMKYADGNAQYQYCGEYKRNEIDAEKRAESAWVESKRAAKVALFGGKCESAQQELDELEKRRPAEVRDKPALSFFYTFDASDGAVFTKYEKYREHAQKLIDDWKTEANKVRARYNSVANEKKLWQTGTTEDIRKHVFDGAKRLVTPQDVEDIRQILRENEVDFRMERVVVKRLKEQKDRELTQFKAEQRELHRVQNRGRGLSR